MRGSALPGKREQCLTAPPRHAFPSLAFGKFASQGTSLQRRLASPVPRPTGEQAAGAVQLKSWPPFPGRVGVSPAERRILRRDLSEARWRQHLWRNRKSVQAGRLNRRAGRPPCPGLPVTRLHLCLIRSDDCFARFSREGRGFGDELIDVHVGEVDAWRNRRQAPAFTSSPPPAPRRRRPRTRRRVFGVRRQSAVSLSERSGDAAFGRARNAAAGHAKTRIAGAPTPSLRSCQSGVGAPLCRRTPEHFCCAS